MQAFITLKVITIRLKLGKLPREDILIAICLISPTIPSICTLMDDRGNLVQEVGQISLEYIRVVYELVDLAYHKDGVDFLPRDHNLQVSIA